jgi:hypothetical protein
MLYHVHNSHDVPCVCGNYNMDIVQGALCRSFITPFQHILTAKDKRKVGSCNSKIFIQLATDSSLIIFLQHSLHAARI